MASIAELKRIIDLHDLASRLSLKRPGGDTGNYCSPHHADKSPSLSIFKDGKAWKDFSDDDAGGDCVSLIMFVEGIADVPSGMRRLHEIYGIAHDRKDIAPRARRSTVDFIADRCMQDTAPATAYLLSRGVKEVAIKLGIARKTIGFTTWVSDKKPAGDVGHAGPGVAFIVRDSMGTAVAVDVRYADPVLNGGVKTQTQGEKDGVFWTACPVKLKQARTVYVVESAINALCVDSCGMAFTAALAIRGTGNAPNIDWSLLIGKQVILALDADLPNEKGKRAGAEASWVIYDLLVGLNIACQMVDQTQWYKNELNDVADIAQKMPAELKARMVDVEPWAIPGLPGKDGPQGRNRVFLPMHDFAVYWRFRCKADFTSYVTKVETTAEGNEQPQFEDVAGFRVAAISRVSIAGATAMMTGELDLQPEVVFAVGVQTPRHGAKLIRRVFDDDKLHNSDMWKRFGPVFNQARLLRLVNIMERSAECGARDAINFVGLAYRNCKPVVNEGPDCYFRDPEKQCPYNNLVFASGTTADAQTVIAAYQSTFKGNRALLALVWSLGAHLKAFIGFWPHLVMQAEKGSGKSTLVKRLERTVGMTVFSGQSLMTEFRQLCSVSYTSHPVGWEELSARKQDVIDKAVALLQEAYNYTPTRRNSDMLPYLICAPVLLAGEDVPVRSLLGKLVQTDLSKRMGPLMPENLPRFPVRQWLQFLCELTREQVLERLTKWEKWCGAKSRATGDNGAPSLDADDPGASRVMRNYSALALAWSLLCEFSGVDPEQGNFLPDLREEMNAFIKRTSGDRQPWVWILETLTSEIESHRFEHPYLFDEVDGEACILLRPQHVIDHISTDSRLRQMWDGLPVKTGRVFAAQLAHAGLVVKDECDKRINSKRVAHLTALSLDRMRGYGLYLSTPDAGYAS
ncbi:MAG: toprim domain-containing protein [Pseudomonadota bacterium]|nr:toprim domain-containing protein [Pseudomonadota bacterium]